MKKYIEIVEFATGDVIKRLDVTGKSEREIELIDNGVNINLNHNDYFTRENESDEALPLEE